jgi:hypothetical protein
MAIMAGRLGGPGTPEAFRMVVMVVHVCPGPMISAKRAMQKAQHRMARELRGAVIAAMAQSA